MEKRHTIVSVGEVLWDVFPDGPRFGGAPANVACHAAALGADAVMVSCVGHDELGTRALAELAQRNVDAGSVRVSESYPTGTVQVELDASGKPRFTIGENVAWDHLAWSDQLDALALRTRAVCFGTLGQRHENSRHVIGRFVASVPHTALRVLDVNLRPPFYNDGLIQHSLNLANVLKLSDDELDRVATACDIAGSEAELLEELSRRYDLQTVALTRGERGATLMRGPDRSDCPAFPVTVQDTVGAGDAFTATLILGLLNHRPLDDINRHACRVAAYVCTQSGATPPLPATLRG
ncbi:MAG: carbohydrate kinase [Planctomycetes bacterium]|nr:carbohydrate kinase [Planctomycetota bacterium]